MWVYVIGKRTSVSEEKEPVVSVKLFSPLPLRQIILTLAVAEILAWSLKNSAY